MIFWENIMENATDKKPLVIPETQVGFLEYTILVVFRVHYAFSHFLQST